MPSSRLHHPPCCNIESGRKFALERATPCQPLSVIETMGRQFSVGRKQRSGYGPFDRAIDHRNIEIGAGSCQHGPRCSKRDFSVKTEGCSVVRHGLVKRSHLSKPKCSATLAVRRPDNSRYMHGRTQILDTRARCIATFFGCLRFALRDPEEPRQAPWRKADFQPPLSSALAAYR